MASWRVLRIGCVLVVLLMLLTTLGLPPAEAHIEFWPYDAPSAGFTTDNRKREPVNAVFWGQGDAAVVNHHMVIQLGWYDCRATGTTKWAFIQDNHFGGHSEQWTSPDYQVCKGNYFGTRFHARVYDGYYDPHQFGEWSIVEIHKEVWSWRRFNHVVVSWEEAEGLVRGDFTGKSYVSSLGNLNLGNAGCFGNYDPFPCNDGNAASIQLNS